MKCYYARCNNIGIPFICDSLAYLMCKGCIKQYELTNFYLPNEKYAKCVQCKITNNKKQLRYLQPENGRYSFLYCRTCAKANDSPWETMNRVLEFYEIFRNGRPIGR